MAVNRDRMAEGRRNSTLHSLNPVCSLSAATYCFLIEIDSFIWTAWHEKFIGFLFKILTSGVFSYTRGILGMGPKTKHEFHLCLMYILHILPKGNLLHSILHPDFDCHLFFEIRYRTFHLWYWVFQILDFPIWNAHMCSENIDKVLYVLESECKVDGTFSTKTWDYVMSLFLINEVLN